MVLIDDILVMGSWRLVLKAGSENRGVHARSLIEVGTR